MRAGAVLACTLLFGCSAPPTTPNTSPPTPNVVGYHGEVLFEVEEVVAQYCPVDAAAVSAAFGKSASRKFALVSPGQAPRQVWCRYRFGEGGGFLQIQYVRYEDISEVLSQSQQPYISVPGTRVFPAGQIGDFVSAAIITHEASDAQPAYQYVVARATRRDVGAEFGMQIAAGADGEDTLRRMAALPSITPTAPFPSAMPILDQATPMPPPRRPH